MSTPPDPAPSGGLDDLVERLRALKVWAGDPSYEAITHRIGEVASRSTVANCFQPGRRRLSTELVLAVVRALVLDNAATADQVLPLLPSTPGCLVMITSRRSLSALGQATHVPVNVFTPAEALAFLTAAVPGVPVGADPGAATRIAGRCGYLPLALGLVAGHIRSTPGWTLTDHAERLDDRHRDRRLDTGSNWRCGSPTSTSRPTSTFRPNGGGSGARRRHPLVGGGGSTASTASTLMAVGARRSGRCPPPPRRPGYAAGEQGCRQQPGLNYGHLMADHLRRTRPLLRTLVGDVLRRRRQEQRRTLAEVAREANVSVQYLSEVERGRKEPSSEILAAVCDSLYIDLADLLAEVGRDLQIDHTPVLRLDTARLRRAQTRTPSPAPRPTRSGDVLLLAAPSRWHAPGCALHPTRSRNAQRGGTHLAAHSPRAVRRRPAGGARLAAHLAPCGQAAFRR